MLVPVMICFNWKKVGNSFFLIFNHCYSTKFTVSQCVPNRSLGYPLRKDVQWVEMKPEQPDRGTNYLCFFGFVLKLQMSFSERNV